MSLGEAMALENAVTLKNAAEVNTKFGKMVLFQIKEETQKKTNKFLFSIYETLFRTYVFFPRFFNTLVKFFLSFSHLYVFPTFFSHIGGIFYSCRLVYKLVTSSNYYFFTNSKEWKKSVTIHFRKNFRVSFEQEYYMGYCGPSSCAYPSAEKHIERDNSKYKNSAVCVRDSANTSQGNDRRSHVTSTGVSYFLSLRR